MKKFSYVLLCAAFSLASNIVFAAGPNLVVNGDFESGDFFGWTQSGNTAQQFVGPDYSLAAIPHTGNVFSDGAFGSLGYISQNIDTVIGGKYSLEFDLQRIDSTVLPQVIENHSVVSFGNAQLLDEMNVSNDWKHYSFNDIVVTAKMTNLVFGNANTYDYTQIDNVSLVMTGSVPEPETYAMLFAGLGCLALLGKRRQFA